MRPIDPSQADRLPVAIIAIIAVIALIVVVVVVLAGIDSIIRRNQVPSIGVSDVTHTEGGCLNGTPYVTFQVTLWNTAFGDGTAQVSFYQDNALLGSEQWFVHGRDRTHSESVSYTISSCGGHMYTYHLDSVM